jgi:V8-like Glu-specific endopeptidase
VETITGQKIGSGFVVRAQDFFPQRAADELIFLTNAHVISPLDAPSDGSIPASAACIQFEATGCTCTVSNVIWSRPVSSLEATFVALKTSQFGTEVCPLQPPATEFNPAQSQRLYVIGYPLGGGLSFSLQDSAWLDADSRVLHYRTPTEPGSSGSPVFDQNYWTAVALHHKGLSNMQKLNGKSGTYEANEGISLKAICQEARSSS